MSLPSENTKGQEPLTWLLTYFCVLAAFTAAATLWTANLVIDLLLIFLGA